MRRLVWISILCAACGEPATPLTYPGHEKLLADPARFDAEDYERLRRGAAGDPERLFVIALAAYGFWISLAGRPIFKDSLAEAAPARF